MYPKAAKTLHRSGHSNWKKHSVPWCSKGTMTERPFLWNPAILHWRHFSLDFWNWVMTICWAWNCGSKLQTHRSLLLVVWASKSHRAIAGLNRNHIVQLWNFKHRYYPLYPCMTIYEARAGNACTAQALLQQSICDIQSRKVYRNLLKIKAHQLFSCTMYMYSIPKLGNFRAAPKNISAQKETWTVC